MLKTYGEAGLVFNSDKFQFCQDVVRFAGLEVTEKGVRPAKDFLDAILHLPPPNNISDVRAFFGMVNQVSYAFSMSSICLLYTSPSPRDGLLSRMPSSA